MKALFTFFTVLISLTITAQPVWNSSDEPVVGDSAYYYLLDSNVTNYSSITGANVAWDYSSVSTYSFDATKKAIAASASHSAYFNFYPYASHDSYVENNLHNFYSSDGTTRTSYGLQVNDPTQGDILVTYDGYTDRTYPWTYQSQSNTTLSNGKIVIYPNSVNPPQIKENAGGIYAAIGDAYGSLTIGDTVITDVLRNNIEDSIRANLGVAGNETLIRSQFEYYAPGMTFPVFVHSHIKIYGTIINTEYSMVLSLIKPKISTGIINKPVGSIEFNVRPNPASNFVLIEADPSIRITEVKVYDLNGRIQHAPSTMRSNLPEIDISALTNGIYFVQVRSAQDLYFTKKLIKSGS